MLTPSSTLPPLECGVFTLSLDFELLWGTLDIFGPDGLRRECETERDYVIDRLLALFAEFDIPATWCIVGHLFLDRCTPHDGVKHPEIVPPTHSWIQDSWFAHDPCGEEEKHPLYYGRKLIEKIVACPVPQEVGCHTFSHVIFGDTGCSPETAQSELAACVQLAEDMGITMRSFAFPRNKVGHLETLREHGFWCYRGPEPNWYEPIRVRLIRRLSHLWDILTAARPPVVLPEQTDEGLWNVPGSMLYLSMFGIRRHIPLGLRTRRAIKGLNAAAQQNRIFHLWFHPTDMAENMEAMFAGLRTILECVDSLRVRKKLQVLPMRALVPMTRSDVISAPNRHTVLQ